MRILLRYTILLICLLVGAFFISVPFTTRNLRAKGGWDGGDASMVLTGVIIIVGSLPALSWIERQSASLRWWTDEPIGDAKPSLRESPRASTMERLPARCGGRQGSRGRPPSRHPRSGQEIMQYNPANPLIVQGDRTILLEVDNPLHAEARDAIAPFAELEKSPEHIHTYRLTPLSLWNAAAAGMTAEAMVEALETYSEVPSPRQPAARPPRAGRPIRAGPAAPGRRPAPADHRRPAAAGGTGARARGARLPGRAGRRDQFRH